MPRKELSPVSPDNKYGLNWGSSGCIEITSIETGETLVCLLGNYPIWIIRAAFSRDMQRILCLNWGGSVGVWHIPPLAKRKPGTHTIVDFLCTDRERYSRRRNYD